jgi:hypothetical protein
MFGTHPYSSSNSFHPCAATAFSVGTAAGMASGASVV